VFQLEIISPTSGGKSDPTSTIHPTDFERLFGVTNRAPMAAYEPAPPIISFAGGIGGRYSISSDESIVSHSTKFLRLRVEPLPMMNIPSVQNVISSSMATVNDGRESSTGIQKRAKPSFTSHHHLVVRLRHLRPTTHPQNDSEPFVHFDS
jgi:hypothetical protein